MVKKTISVILAVIMILPGSWFHSLVIALILVVMWRQKLKEWILPKWKYGYKALVVGLSVLTLLLMPRPFALPTDRARMVYLDEDYNPTLPPLHHWLLNIILPEETACTWGMAAAVSPLRGLVPLPESILKNFDHDLKNLRLSSFLSSYNSLALSLESPLSGAYAQGENIIGGNSTRNAYIIKPKHFDADKEYPVVFFAHGYLGNWKLYNGLLKDLDDKIVVSFGTRDLSGIYTRADIQAIFTKYIPMLEEMGYRPDLKEISLLGLSNGGSAVDIAYANFPDRFKNIVYISTGVNHTNHTKAKVMIIGGGLDHCAPSMKKAIQRLQSNGQNSAILFDEDATHFMMVTERRQILDFLNREL